MTMTKIDRRALLTTGGALSVAALGIAGARAIGAPPATTAAAPDFGGRIPVAFVMGPGSTMIDFAGPWEVFQDAGDGENQAFYLYTVSDSTDEIMTTGNFLNDKMNGLRFRPDYGFSDAPQPRVIMMGAQGGHTPAKIDWIRNVSAKADYVFSNCTGAFLLAKTGLLDGLQATTHHDFFDGFEKQFPKVKLVRDARYVDNGKIITSGGLTSGIDGALHIVERMLGRERAERTIAYMEYSGEGWRTRARA
ncbi:MAG TPA: DJ-1/PfpI family protein [Sphingomicrobium sp.]|jgi:transcriptional regulator GlxA family with amidase domain|nr:DJ-1/PfpI family protein [Sphingomicrobium sp.]